jgi:hypothetical protein
MKSAMPEFRPSSDAPQSDDAASCNSIRNRMLVGLVLFTLVRAGEALAGEQASITNTSFDPDFANLRQRSPTAPAPIAAPVNFSAPAAGDYPVFSATDFRPRKHSVFDSDPTVNSFAEAPMLRGTTIWQRMAEYKSHDGVRLLTLWESRGSTISLQAGRRGDPSLQWTSRLMNHGGSTQGLLDRLFSVSLARAGNGLRNATRPASSAMAPTTAKPLDLAGVAGLK